MLKINLIFVFLAVFATAGCVGGLGGGSASSDTGVTSVASLSDGGRVGPRVSDSEITRSIQSAFREDDLLANANITVNSEQGIVSMSGRLTARAANRAMSLARSAPGVQRVVWASIDYIPE
jgi:osmotically-inducible protein OsmY